MSQQIAPSMHWKTRPVGLGIACTSSQTMSLLWCYLPMPVAHLCSLRDVALARSVPLLSSN
jgi:hypothetical protein